MRMEPGVEKGLRAFLKEPFSGLSHLASALAAVAGLVVLENASLPVPAGGRHSPSTVFP